MTKDAEQLQIIELLQNQIDGLLTQQNDLQGRLAGVERALSRLELRYRQLEEVRNRLQADYDLLHREVVALRIERDELRIQNAQLRKLHSSASAGGRQRDKRSRR